MTQSPNSGNNQESTNRRLHLLLLKRTGLVVGTILLAGIASGIWWARRYVYNDLAPLVATNLEQLLGRPVKLGKVEGFSLSSLRFASLFIPATSTDLDQVTAKAVKVEFSPLQLILTRKLPLNVTLVQPQVYIQQDQDGRWVTADVKTEEGKGAIQIELQSLKIVDGNVELLPAAAPTRPPGAVVLKQVGGVAKFAPDNQGIGYEINAQLNRGGAVKIAGETQLQTQQTNLQLAAQNLLASDVSRLIQLPIVLQAGRVDADLGVKIPANLAEIAITGTATPRQVTAKIQNIPQQFFNANGKLIFQGQTIALENFNTNLGTVPLIANGVVNLKTGFNLVAQVKPVNVKNILDSLKVNLPVVATGEVQANVNLQGSLQQPVLMGTVKNTKPVQVDRVSFSSVNTDFRLSVSEAASQIALSNLKLVPAAGGAITGSGQAQLGGQVKFNLAVADVSGDILAQSYSLAPPLKIGNVSAKAEIIGSLGQQPLVMNIASVQVQPPAGGQIVGSGQVQLAPQGQVSLDVQGQNLPGDAFANTNDTIKVGAVAAKARISGTLGNLQAVAKVQAPAATYPTTAEVVVAQQGSDILFPRAVVNVAGGTITARGQVRQQRWQAVVNAQQLQLKNFAQIPPQIQGVLSNAALNLSGSTVSLQADNIRATGRASLNVAGGAVNLRNINLDAGRWQTVANATQIQLNRLSPQLQGRLSSNVQLAGTTASLQLADIRASGKVRTSQGIAPLTQPLTAQFAWDGKQIIVQRATTPGLTASGAIAVQLPPTGTPQIAGFNLNVQAQAFNLQNTSVAVPGDLAIAGLLDFNGRVTGTLDTPQATGNIRLRNFNVSNLAFDPVLTGKVNLPAGEGASLQLAGTQDRIAVNLNADYRPTSFLIQRDRAIVTGKTEGDNLLINAQQFPIALASSFLPDKRLQPLGGELSGNLVVNLNNYAVAGDIAIIKPRVARASAAEFRGNINYADGTASLTNGQLRLKDSNISLSGSLQTGNDPKFQLQANVDQIKIAQLLQAVSIFDLQDLNTGLEPPTLAGAAALNTTPVSLPIADLQTQLEYFSKITTSVTPQPQADTPIATLIPPLSELTGAVTGAITASGSLKSGLNVGFDIQGANWQWGEYAINQVTAQGNFADGILTLSPLSIGIEQGLVAFAGKLGIEQLSGELNVASLPLSLLQPLIAAYPVDITGEVNAVAKLQGSLTDPSVNGEVSLANATLNQQPVQTAQVKFDYNNSRVDFDSTLLLTGTQPITITGKIPAPLPFVAAPPDNNQIDITASVNNQGLSLLNLLTNNQVNWVDGEGQVSVNVQGTLNQPIINGSAIVNNATFRTLALSDPLTNVTGKVQFNGNTVNVESIQGNYNQGLVNASGILPILTPEPAAPNPLTVFIEQQLNFQVPGLYTGGVSGNASIRGTALKPQIGGEIALSNGQVLIGKSATVSPQLAPQLEGDSTGAVTPPNLPIEFTDLRLILGDDVRVTTQPLFSFLPGVTALSQPLLSFDARGELTINGTLAKPLPKGEIRLTGGRLSLFSTEFTLARGYEHTARFTPSQGLDPILDVRLVAIVPEASATTNRILESPVSAEISDAAVNNFGTLRTVRVQARATGPASELTDNLELTSEPGRSRGEIVALLGGSILNFLGQTGDATQGLTNFASSTVLGGLQGTITAIGQAVGFSEFRIFPTPNTSQAARRSSVLDLSAEGVFNLNRNLSVSLSRALASNDSFRYNLLYRLNDEILVRGSTNLGDESQLRVEYETRF
ncbi:MAG: translocation/assembly module TamB domain-containing protein [Goleter apudmare HA4340-LM2]|jgi:translocation and assembly module TamB|nr:translocation/assembly module TamB domain-containing protein [Goleter apudmare HA4340-LM2]